MAISIDWGTSVITVPKADTVLIQTSPTEIRELNLDDFRLQLKELEESIGGMPHLKTHNHNTTVDVGGISLARVVNILDPYTITFEDGQYAVNLVGANSNVGDRVNVNQVSVRSFNSAGLVNNEAIENISFLGAVHLDQTSLNQGTRYPVGTYERPVNNIDDAITILNTRGFSTINIIGSASILGKDISGINFTGDNRLNSLIYLSTGTVTNRTTFKGLTLTGVVNGPISGEEIAIQELEGVGSTEFPTIFERCIFSGDGINSSITLSSVETGYENIHFIECVSGAPELGAVTLDVNNSDAQISFRKYAGGITVENYTEGQDSTLGMSHGEIFLNESCTNGTIRTSGIYRITNNSSLLVEERNESVNSGGGSSVWTEQEKDLALQDINTAKRQAEIAALNTQKSN